MSETKIVDIKGVKIQIEAPQAKIIENYRIGDTIKILIKEYSDSWTSYPGIIVGFDDFDELPTIIICYISNYYSTPEIKTAYFHEKCDKIEITKCCAYELSFDYEAILDALNNDLKEKQIKAEEVKAKINYFMRHFGEKFAKFANEDK